MSIPEKTFSLTAQAATLDLGAGHKVDTWRFNGAAPGLELRVQ
jgi:hypothetical protein